jgi:hypothetical protein
MIVQTFSVETKAGVAEEILQFHREVFQPDEMAKAIENDLNDRMIAAGKSQRYTVKGTRDGDTINFEVDDGTDGE